jgi:hypothetical protein
MLVPTEPLWPRCLQVQWVAAAPGGPLIMGDRQPSAPLFRDGDQLRCVVLRNPVLDRRSQPQGQLVDAFSVDVVVEH